MKIANDVIAVRRVTGNGQKVTVTGEVVSIASTDGTPHSAPTPDSPVTHLPSNSPGTMTTRAGGEPGGDRPARPHR
jgi:hypothetical protein